MSKKLQRAVAQDGVCYDLLFWCPGCEEPHPYRITPYPGSTLAWQFNGDMERPTFTPSLRVFGGQGTKCHLFVTDGRIDFCGDSAHALAGNSVPLPDWPWGDELHGKEGA